MTLVKSLPVPLLRNMNFYVYLFLNVVKSVKVATSIKQPPVFKCQYFVNLTVHLNSQLTCSKHPPAFKGHFHCPFNGCLRQVRLYINLFCETKHTKTQQQLSPLFLKSP